MALVCGGGEGRERSPVNIAADLVEVLQNGGKSVVTPTAKGQMNLDAVSAPSAAPSRGTIVLGGDHAAGSRGQ